MHSNNILDDFGIKIPKRIFANITSTHRKWIFWGSILLFFFVKGSIYIVKEIFREKEEAVVIANTMYGLDVKFKNGTRQYITDFDAFNSNYKPGDVVDANRENMIPTKIGDRFIFFTSMIVWLTISIFIILFLYRLFIYHEGVNDFLLFLKDN